MDENNTKIIIQVETTDDSSKEKPAKSALNLLFRKYISPSGVIAETNGTEWLALQRFINPIGIICKNSLMSLNLRITKKKKNIYQD